MEHRYETRLTMSCYLRQLSESLAILLKFFTVRGKNKSLWRGCRKLTMGGAGVEAVGGAEVTQVIGEGGLAWVRMAGMKRRA